MKVEEKSNKKSVFARKETWITLIIGILIGIILLFLLELIPAIGSKIKIGSNLIVKTKAGKITENDLYLQMKKLYPVDYILELVDKEILDKEYTLTEEQEKEVNEQADDILKQYKDYGYTVEQFCKENGFADKEDFVNYLKFSYKRNLYCIDYFKTLLSEDEIKNYYNSNEIYGTVEVKHILVQTSSETTDEQALAKANEIIGKLNDGTSFDDVAEEYADEAISQTIKFDSFDASSYATSFVEASKNLEPGTYTKEAVQTDYGYHIIYCVSKKGNLSFEQAENDIVETLASPLEQSDSNIRSKALIKLREENNINFKDKKYAEEYKEYCDKKNED